MLVTFQSGLRNINNINMAVNSMLRVVCQTEIEWKPHPVSGVLVGF